MSWLVDELKHLKFTGEAAAFTAHHALADALKRVVARHDVVVIKGSRSMAMEKVWAAMSSP